MRWRTDIAAWMHGFQTGVDKELGVAPTGLDARSWLAGYLEGVEPPKKYGVVEDNGRFYIQRFDADGYDWEIEADGFDSRDYAEEFIRALGLVMSKA